MGDEVMATFPSADAALNAAAQMQQQISTHAQLKVDGQPVAIRIGCHYGPVMLENRDVFGAAVHTANRMTSQAKAGQIVTTAATVDKLSPEWRASCRQIDVATLDRKSTRLNSSHLVISYAVFCLKKKKTTSKYTLRTRSRRIPIRTRCRRESQLLCPDARNCPFRQTP